MTDIATALGVSRVTLHRYCRTKDDIVELVIKREAERLVADLPRHVGARRVSANVLVERLVRGALLEIAERPVLARATLFDLSAVSPVVTPRIHELVESIVPLVEAFVADRLDLRRSPRLHALSEDLVRYVLGLITSPTLAGPLHAQPDLAAERSAQLFGPAFAALRR